MNRRPALACMVIGAFALLAGGVGIYGYFQEAVWARWGEPDQSLLFWYLPFLLFGAILSVTGGVLLYLGKRAMDDSQPTKAEDP